MTIQHKIKMVNKKYIQCRTYIANQFPLCVCVYLCRPGQDMKNEYRHAHRTASGRPHSSMYIVVTPVTVSVDCLCAHDQLVHTSAKVDTGIRQPNGANLC